MKKTWLMQQPVEVRIAFVGSQHALPASPAEELEWPWYWAIFCLDNSMFRSIPTGKVFHRYLEILLENCIRECALVSMPIKFRPHRKVVGKCEFLTLPMLPAILTLSSRGLCVYNAIIHRLPWWLSPPVQKITPDLPQKFHLIHYQQRRCDYDHR